MDEDYYWGNLTAVTFPFPCEGIIHSEPQKTWQFIFDYNFG